VAAAKLRKLKKRGGFRWGVNDICGFPVGTEGGGRPGRFFSRDWKEQGAHSLNSVLPIIERGGGVSISQTQRTEGRDGKSALRFRQTNGKEFGVGGIRREEDGKIKERPVQKACQA